MNIVISGFDVRELAANLGTSERTLGRRLKNVLGLTLLVFIRQRMLEKSRNYNLLHQFNTVAEMVYSVGFAQPSYFAK